MYSIDQLQKGLKNPSLILNEISYLRNKLIRNLLYNFNRKLKRNSGIHVMEQDWDNLIILDACRYDLYEREVDISDDLISVISKGSSTAEFLNKNFSGNTYNDTIYITANPHLVSQNLENNFFKSVQLWDTHWDEQLKTVHPSVVRDESLKIAQEYPNKRIIIHFIQPHYPFIGETGRNMNHGTMKGNGLLYEERDSETVWELLENGELDSDKIWKAYTENLQITIPYVLDLIDNLEGKSIVTSDHGNSFGKWGIYGHPPNEYTSELVKVPWHVFDSNARKEIHSEKPLNIKKKHDSVEKRLTDLGYK